MQDNRHPSTQYLVQLSLLAAIEIILAFTPLGYIPVGVVRATTIHIPVIIGGIVLGPMAGAILGGLFGLTSIVINTITPTVTSFVFSPFYSVGATQGNGYSLLIALVPRILIGVVAGWVFRFVASFDKSKVGACIAAGLLGSMTNTVLVLGGIYVFFGEGYAAAKNIPLSGLFTALMGIVSFNGVIEAVVAAIITVALAQPILRFINRAST